MLLPKAMTQHQRRRRRQGRVAMWLLLAFACAFVLVITSTFSVAAAEGATTEDEDLDDINKIVGDTSVMKYLKEQTGIHKHMLEKLHNEIETELASK